MTSAQKPWKNIQDLAIGDMVTTPEGRTASVRLLAMFPDGISRPWQTGGFVILGNFDAVMVTSRYTTAITAYIPIESVPTHIASSALLAEGTAGFLAPHLPSDASALEPISWRAYRMVGRFEPLLVVYRGPQILVFLPATNFDTNDITVVHLPKSGSNVKPATRHTVLVDLPAAPVESLPSIRNRSKSHISRSKR